ncbi:MAG TPA: phospho-N-acetylmuramoyl-pentapeptide-transferase [Saprospiraceae bacterium]|nr:phospho-N-acetylmuramoyl-pentapeptide-transferase [Saprospiraceae bacterium]
MLYYLFEYLDQQFDLPGAGLWRFITFRAGAAVILSLLISMVFGGRIVNFLRKLQIGESIRDLGLEGQLQKKGTPTMGGIIIIMAILIPCLLMADLQNIYILLMLLATTWMGIIGFVDDFIKVFKKNKEGLSGKFKVMGQIGLGLIVAITMLYHEDIVVRMPGEEAEQAEYEVIKSVEEADGSEWAYVKTTLTNLPFLKNNNLDYRQLLWFLGDNADKWVWIIFIPIVIFIVTAVSNAANLTDGLDGLATGVSAIIGVTLGIFAYVSGNAIAAKYLNIMFLPGTSELVIFSACFLGACIGFLWYNAYPAQVFMGDTGSLTLGGIIAALAIVLRKELLIPVLCGIFLIENLSVVMQVSYFKYTKRKYGEGRRIFLMSPLHHHFQKKGIPEAKIVTRFWIVGILLAVVTVLTLKIR